MVQLSRTIKLYALILCAFAQVSGARQYCYSGSNLYQSEIINCVHKDPSYNGTWYCTKLEVCEPYMSRDRICVISTGCATADDCQGFSNGQPLTIGGVKPAGMTITPNCCKANSFNDDDATAVDYSLICNGASGLKLGSITATVAMLLVVFLLH